MALDIIGRVLTVYKADTSDEKAKIKELAGEQRKLAQERLKAVEESNKGVESQIKSLAKLGVAIGVAAAAFKTVEHTARKAQLQLAATGVNIEGLAKASGGLRTEMQLLEQAARLQHGAFKLTQIQMEMVQRAQRELVREGNDQAEVTKKVTDAIVKLEGDGLKDFGIRVKEAKTDTEKFNAVMEALSTTAAKADGAVLTESESIQKLGVQFQDAFDRIKTSMGQVVMAMAPLIEGVGRLAEGAATLVETSSTGWRALAAVAHGDRKAFFAAFGRDAEEYGGSGEMQARDFLEEYQLQGGNPADIITTGLGGGSNPLDIRGGSGAKDTSLAEAQARQAARIEREKAKGIYRDESAAKAAAKAAKEKAAAKAVKLIDYWLDSQLEYIAQQGELGQGEDDEDFVSQMRRSVHGPSESVDGLGGISDPGGADLRRQLDLLNAPQAYGEFQHGKAQTFLEKTFGPVDEFDLYAQAFQALTGAVGSALGAWIDGSKSAGDAFKAFIGEAVKGIAIQMAMEAIKHGAFAIGSLAFGDVAGAALHGKSAAMFAAGALIASAAAKGLHQGSSGGTGAGYTPSAPSSSGGGAAAPQGTHTVYVIGDHFSEDSPRKRAANFRRQAAQAVGSSGVMMK